MSSNFKSTMGKAASFALVLGVFVAVLGQGAFTQTNGMPVLFSDDFKDGNTETLEGYVWKKLGGPHGGIGYDIRMHPDNPDIMYVTDAWMGVHMSLDGGQTWFPSNEGIEARTGPSGDAIPSFSVTIDPHNPDVIWAGMTGQRGIFKSTDGGQTWSLKVNGIKEQAITFRGFTIDPHQSNIVYAAGEISSGEWAGREVKGAVFDKTKGKVYRTTDGGESWTAIWSGDNLARYVWIDPRDTNVIYISTGIFDREAANTDVAAKQAGGVGIVKSTDGGRTWRVLGEANGLTGLYVGSLFMHPENPDILLAGVGHDYWSRSWGETENRRYSDAGVFLTTDGGETWEKVLDDDLIMSVEFSLANPNIAYAASDRNFYRSEDGGRTWRRVGAYDFWGPPGVIAAFPIDIQVDPSDPMRLFVNNYQGGNFLSTDGGETWSTASQGYSGAQISGGITVDPQNPARIYVGALSGLFRSDDGGETWNGLAFSPARFNQINTLAVSPDDFNLVIKSPWDIGNRLARSEDGGLTWTLVPVGSPDGVQFTQLSFTPADPQTVYAAIGGVQCKIDTFECNQKRPGGGVYVSHDAGQSWQPANDANIKDQNVIALTVHPENAQVVYAGTSNSGIYRTTDGGQNWRAINKGLSDTFVRALAIDPQNPEVIYLGTASGGLYRSPDGGETWIWSSAGMNPSESINAIVVHPMQPNVVYAGGQFSGVYLSEDAGETWHLINDGLGTRAVLTLAISSDGKVLYAGTQGAGVFRLGEPPEFVAPPTAPPPAAEPPVITTPPTTEPPVITTPPTTKPPATTTPPTAEPPVIPAPPTTEPPITTTPPVTQPPTTTTEKTGNILPYLGGALLLLLGLIGWGWWRWHSHRKMVK